jgi:hypothetical protein
MNSSHILEISCISDDSSVTDKLSYLEDEKYTTKDSTPRMTATDGQLLRCGGGTTRFSVLI